MSSLLGRLCWDGRRGIAVWNGVQVELRSCPLPVPVTEVDYAPPLKVYMVREGAQRPRDMTDAERAVCQSLLDSCSAAARAAFYR